VIQNSANELKKLSADTQAHKRRCGVMEEIPKYMSIKKTDRKAGKIHKRDWLHKSKLIKVQET
jgi:hypothetical protein